ncbi:HupE/UreJ family protein [Halodurantibacterium flavum]|uniref:HupE/UreJ family protein n=1 Tax=Halodurantibacterium flavum TaxID=1382802 RepID=A0ABW4S6J9_9RHOB
MKRIILSGIWALFALPAAAHHPMGGAAPVTLFEGLASGLAHPVIGVDHLAFIVLVGLAAAASQRLLAGPAAFILATLAGTFLQLAGATLPLAEIIISGSVVVLGALLFLGHRVAGPSALAGFAFAGLFHGWAYGEAVIGSEPMPVLAYLIGFGLIQFAIAAGVARLAHGASQPEGWVKARIAAAVCAGVGLAFLVEGIEGMIFA